MCLDPEPIDSFEKGWLFAHQNLVSLLHIAKRKEKNISRYLLNLKPSHNPPNDKHGRFESPLIVGISGEEPTQKRRLHLIPTLLHNLISKTVNILLLRLKKHRLPSVIDVPIRIWIKNKRIARYSLRTHTENWWETHLSYIGTGAWRDYIFRRIENVLKKKKI